MAVEWKEAPQSVIDMATGIIEAYHPSLEDAAIGFILRSEAPVSGGKKTLGKARKVSDEQRVFMDFDFVIWLAEDEWLSLEKNQRRALIDHELCHCYMTNDGKTKIRPHDVEEFNCIIERYGFWWPESEPTQDAVQASIPGVRQGRVESVPVENNRDVMDQIGDIM